MATNRTASTYYSLIAATVGAGLALAVLNVSAAANRLPEPSPVSAVSVGVAEDDPGWDCFTMGNFICGDPDGTHAADAWDAWDRTEGWRRLRAATTEVRVEYVGTATQSPTVDALTEVAVPARSGWFVFRAVTEPLPVAPYIHTPVLTAE